MATTQKTIRIVLVDRQPYIDSNLVATLSESPAIQIIGQAVDRSEALQLCQITGPDLVLVNLLAPDLDGISIVRLVSNQFPHMTVLVFADTQDKSELRAALEAGAAGYLPPDATPEYLAGAIQHVVEGKRTTAISQASPPLITEPPSVIDPASSEDLRSSELAEAARIQTSLLPALPPIIPGWELAVKMKPARETSGDFYDFIPLEHGKYAIVIGDVSDKGLGAALFMAMTSTLFRTFIPRQPSMPALIMSQVNERILSDSGGSSFVTTFLSVLEPNTGRLRYANGGHVPPLMVGSQRGKTIDHLSRTGMALGVHRSAAWQQKLVKFAPGDFLVMYTDGILDAQNCDGDFYGHQRLTQAARAQPGATAKQIVEGILTDVAHFTEDAPVNDDLILMVLARRK